MLKFMRGLEKGIWSLNNTFKFFVKKMQVKIEKEQNTATGL